MAMMTATQYENSLRKLNLVVYMFGERLENVVDDPIIRPSMPPSNLLILLSFTASICNWC